MANDSDERILNGQVWADFCDKLKSAGDIVLRKNSPYDAFDRAEGFRYLSRLTRAALESFIEYSDPRFPVFRRPAHETIKLGADNPDNYYQSAPISGEYEYRIRGRRGTVYYLGFGTYMGGYGSSGRRGQSGYLEGADLAIDSDGKFEILVSSKQPAANDARTGKPVNWLPMEHDSSLLIVRQTFKDRTQEAIADLTIERIGGERAPNPLEPALFAQRLTQAAAYVHGTASLFADWAEEFAQKPNELPLFDPARAQAAHGDPNIRYYHGYWKLKPDEALVIEVTPPQCTYWNFQLNNYWMESLDYRYHRIDVNHAGAKYEPDGSIRLIVAARDPGIGNWIDTAGHEHGTMCLRWIRATTHPTPQTKVVQLVEIPR